MATIIGWTPEGKAALQTLNYTVKELENEKFKDSVD